MICLYAYYKYYPTASLLLLLLIALIVDQQNVLLLTHLLSPNLTSEIGRSHLLLLLCIFNPPLLACSLLAVAVVVRRVKVRRQLLRLRGIDTACCCGCRRRCHKRRRSGNNLFQLMRLLFIRNMVLLGAVTMIHFFTNKNFLSTKLIFSDNLAKCVLIFEFLVLVKKYLLTIQKLGIP